MATLEMTTENHDDIVKDGIVLIDFWAEWCGPCRQFGPVFEAAAEKHTDITFAKVDTEAQQQLAMQYGVTSIPTLVAYRDGIPVFGQPGALRENDLNSLIEQVKGLDMDEVRTAYEEQKAKQQG
ncbi:thioredoxin [Helcobacillus massiliensis]|uniref:Thioredoxin n=1 Tax=Helcobacillus massiliensis TaxID=521392 RepID=A0A839QQG5_9MICO|nr:MULTISPECIES: thioredoxin [Helcobacillus]MBB3022564.1 thioredoxin 1 [Helcobacillus massiliensis]MCG7426616.1 thioredoxin [Helcobacillus sp. ACRRO]MCT1557198.1 thioredoxin [Helcobacillus massiliensis]MCT2036952.1 thioredoxin [Helcobacillus massiliensis]MCT2332658.1 thioredoxin [Helcobacillus massiliensis]